MLPPRISELVAGGMELGAADDMVGMGHNIYGIHCIYLPGSPGLYRNVDRVPLSRLVA